MTKEQAIKTCEIITRNKKFNLCNEIDNNDVKAIEEVLNLIQQLQKETEEYKELYHKALSYLVVADKENIEKDKKVNKILNRLDNDIKNITETKVKKRSNHGYLDDYTKCRLKAYRTKTREIKEYIEEIYFEKKVSNNVD